MDTVVPGSKREALRQRIEEAKAALLEAADAGVIKNDPLCQQPQRPRAIRRRAL